MTTSSVSRPGQFSCRCPSTPVGHVYRRQSLRYQLTLKSFIGGNCPSAQTVLTALRFTLSPKTAPSPSPLPTPTPHSPPPVQYAGNLVLSSDFRFYFIYSVPLCGDLTFGNGKKWKLLHLLYVTPKNASQRQKCSLLSFLFFLKPSLDIKGSLSSCCRRDADVEPQQRRLFSLVNQTNRQTVRSTDRQTRLSEPKYLYKN